MVFVLFIYFLFIRNTSAFEIWRIMKGARITSRVWFFSPLHTDFALQAHCNSCICSNSGEMMMMMMMPSTCLLACFSFSSLGCLYSTGMYCSYALCMTLIRGGNEQVFVFFTYYTFYLYLNKCSLWTCCSCVLFLLGKVFKILWGWYLVYNRV